MLKYKGKDSKALTVLVGAAKLAADLNQPLGWAKGDPTLDEGEHSSSQVWAVLEAFGCFAFTTPDLYDPMEVEFYDGKSVNIVGIIGAVLDMPEYTEIMKAGIHPDCFIPF